MKIGSDRSERLMCCTSLLIYDMILCSRGAEESRRTSRGILRKTLKGGLHSFWGGGGIEAMPPPFGLDKLTKWFHHVYIKFLCCNLKGCIYSHMLYVLCTKYKMHLKSRKIKVYTGQWYFANRSSSWKAKIPSLMKYNDRPKSYEITML